MNKSIKSEQSNQNKGTNLEFFINYNLNSMLVKGNIEPSLDSFIFLGEINKQLKKLSKHQPINIIFDTNILPFVTILYLIKIIQETDITLEIMTKDKDLIDFQKNFTDPTLMNTFNEEMDKVKKELGNNSSHGNETETLDLDTLRKIKVIYFE